MLPTSGVSAVLAKLKQVKGSGPWTSLCPAHDDRQHSLSISAGADGRVLVKCHAGCTTSSVVAACGLTMAALFAPSVSRVERTSGKAAGVDQRVKLVKSYDYENPDGTLAFQVCRFDPKTFRQRRPDGNGNWTWGLGDTKPILYRLPLLLEAIAEQKVVHIVEGEKDADALNEFGYVATTSPMGAGKWRDEYSAYFPGVSVIIFPDNDDPGRAHAHAVAGSLHAAGAIVKVVELPGLPVKGDISDWLKTGDLDALEVIIGKTPRWSPDGDTRNRVLFRLDELFENDSIMRPPLAIVPRLAWPGRSTLLASREKAGKSTLIGYIAAAVTRGSKFLGEPCQQGDVLVVGLEEYPGDAARRLQHFDADPTKLHLQIGFRGDPGDRPREIEAAIDKLDPQLVVIDSLAAYGHGMIQDEYNATQMAAVVQPLTNLAHDRGVALVIVHHARKSDGRARGSTAITAGADVVCEYFLPDEGADPTLRRMRSAGRVPVVPVYDIRFDGDHYSLAAGAEAPLETRILAIIADRPGCSVNDVAEAIGGRRETSTRMITDMLVKGIVIDMGENRSRPKLGLPSARGPGLAL